VTRRRNALVVLIAGVCAASAVAQVQDGSAWVPEPKGDSPLWCRHVILVYVKPSGEAADFWTKEKFAWLAAYCDRDGTPKDTFFNGFLILGFSCKGGRNLLHVTQLKPAIKSDWDDTIRNYLAAAQKLSDAFEDVRVKLNRPEAVGRVILAVPCPDKRQRDFGEVNGKRLSFGKEADRVTAVKWYVDETIAAWEKLSQQGRLKGVKLVGFYWGNEGVPKRDAEVTKAACAYVHEKGYLMHWIPYPGGARKDWRALGLDCVTQQINYQSPHKPAVPLTLFERKSRYAQSTGMHGVEMAPMAREVSLNPRVWTWHQVFLANLDAGLRLRWDRCPALTYYHGNHLPGMGAEARTHVFYQQLHRWVKGRLTAEDVKQLSTAALDELKRRKHIDEDTYADIARAPTTLARLQRMEHHKLEGIRQAFAARLAMHNRVSETLITNGSFEDGMEGWPMRAGAVARTQDKARAGQWSLRLSTEPGDGSDMIRAYARSVNVPVRPGRIVRLTAWVHVPEVLKETNRGVLIGLSRYHKGKWVAVWTACEARRTAATDGWERLDVYLPVDDAPCDEVQIMIGMCGVGVAYVDTVELVAFSKP